jgi:hypothetical protein
VKLVDRENRDLGAVILRDFLEGRITNEEFVKRFPRRNDPALSAVFYAVWLQFSDLRVHTLTGRDSPQPERRIILERCYLFLTTDLEFEWPVPKPSLVKGVLSMIGLGRLFRASEEEYKSKGDFAVWPFCRRSDYDAQVQ